MIPDVNEPQSPAPPNPPLDGVELRIEKIRESSTTLGQFVERLFVEVLRPGAGPDYPLFQNEQFCRRLVRYCKPWPEWVLQIAAEVLLVRFPKVKKQTLLDCLRVLHFTFVEARLDESNIKMAPTMPDIDSRFLGAIAGHLLAHFVRSEPATAQNSAGESAKPEQKHSAPTLAELEQQFVPMFASHFQEFPKGFLDFNSALTEAKAATFDKAGNLKKTPLVPVYQKILSDWTEIECMADQKELTYHLSPLLHNKGALAQYDSVRQICSRKRIPLGMSRKSM